MVWTIRCSRSASRAIGRLDLDVRRRVRAALETLIGDPYRGRPLRLTLRGLRSWRTGDYRIIYRIVEQRVEVLVVALGHRREVYERLRGRLD